MLSFAFSQEQEDFRTQLRRFAVAAVALVYAREPGSDGYRGISCLAVPLGLEGVARTHTPGMGALPLWWPPIVAKDAIETAIVTFGNLGYSTEMPLQQRYRDVASYLIADGTAGIQKRIIATAMLGKVAAS